jgi:REP element-mobilizing transposase RayT
MLRGIAGQNIFIDDHDIIRLCLILQAAVEKHQFLIHAFCFMNNHLHFIIEPKQSHLHECVHAFASRYAQYFNRRFERQGYLFQGRFRSILVDDGIYLKHLVRYIHLNPLEAFLVQHPEEYQWSSYRAFIGKDHYAWLTTDLILSRFAAGREEAIQRLIEYTRPQIDKSIDAINISNIFNLGVYGSDDFIKDSMPILESTLEASNKKEFSLEEALSHVCNKYQVNLKQLASESKLKHIVDARSILALLGRVGQQDWNLQDVARLLNKNHGSISRLASRAKQQQALMSYMHILLSS